MATRVNRARPATPTTLEELPLEQLQMNPAIQPRVALHAETIQEYATLYEEAEAADVLPPVDVFQLGAHYAVVDGFHRAQAARQAKRASLLCQVPGSFSFRRGIA